ncbi:MAG: hypothetical protein NT150_02485 [Bacteroidetes bacterium]|nr:hypothetical protein [Bacteroidota bacterium]
MQKGTIYLAIISACILCSCAGTMQTYDLNEEYAKSLHFEGAAAGEAKKAEEEKSDLVGVPALSFYGGDLKRGGIWWAGKGISLEKGDVFLYDFENVGPDSIPFGATFPPLDFAKNKVRIKITARAEGKEGDLPTIFLQLDDVSGYKADAKRPSQKIENSEDFKEYYFELNDIFVQKSPKHAVNSSMINSLKFFINPGLTGYTGKIHIKEIKIIAVAADK